MSVLNEKDDAAAIAPVLQRAEDSAIQGLADKVAPALGEAIKNALDGLTVTITISKKGNS